MIKIKGYPKNINTKQDFKNLLKMPEHKERAKKDLEKIYNTKDSKVTKATELIDPNDPDKGFKTIEINNPKRLFKRFGFKTKKEVKELIDKHKIN